MQNPAPGSKAGAGVSKHDIQMRTCSITPQSTHDLTHEHNRTPQPPLQQDAHITSRPQKQEQSTPAHSTLCRANEIRVWACEMGNGPNPTPRAHARIAKPLTHPAPADRRHRANGGVRWFSLSTQCRRCRAVKFPTLPNSGLFARRFHTQIVFTAPVSINRLKRTNAEESLEVRAAPSLPAPPPPSPDSPPRPGSGGIYPLYHSRPCPLGAAFADARELPVQAGTTHQAGALERIGARVEVCSPTPLEPAHRLV